MDNKKILTVLAIVLVFSLFMTACGAEENKGMIIPVPTTEPEPTEEPKIVFEQLENRAIVAPDGSVYHPYAMQDMIAFFDNFNLWANLNNYIGTIDGQPTGKDVYEELGYRTYEDYLAIVGDFEYGLYAIRNDGAEFEPYPEWILAYFYDREEAVGAEELVTTKSKTAYFYRREAEYGKAFTFENCVRFAAAEDSWLINSALIDKSVGICDPELAAQFMEELKNAATIDDVPIDDRYYDFIYNNFYDKKNNQFKPDSEEKTFHMNRHRNFVLAGFVEGNDLFAYRLLLTRYGNFGYTVTLNGTEYVIDSKWIPLLTNGVEMPPYLYEETASAETEN